MAENNDNKTTLSDLKTEVEGARSMDDLRQTLGRHGLEGDFNLDVIKTAVTGAKTMQELQAALNKHYGAIWQGQPRKISASDQDAINANLEAIAAGKAIVVE